MKLQLLTGVMALGLLSCGKDKGNNAGDANKVIQSFLKLSQGSSQMQFQKAQRVVSKAHRSELRMTTSSGMCSAITSAIADEGCTMNSCDDNGNNFNFSMTCSMPNETLTCGEDTFTFKDATVTQSQTMVISGSSLSGSIAVSMLGTIESTVFNGAVDCQISMNFSTEEASGEFDCDDANFKCTIGGESFSCQDLQEGASEGSCD
jgi:hypothetical protein